MKQVPSTPAQVKGRKSSSWLLQIFAGLLILTWANPAAADFGGNSVSDFDPADVDPEGHGAQIGAFTLYPTLKLGTGFDDNVFATDTGEQDDTFLAAQASALLLSNWTQHRFMLGLSVGGRRYSDQESLDRDSATIDAQLLIDVRRTTQVTIRARYTHKTEYPGDTNLPQTAVENADASTLAGELQLHQDFVTFNVTLAGSITEYDHDDVLLNGGGVFDNDVRDHRETIASARLSIPIGPTVSGFVQGTLNSRDYDQTPPAVALNRNSDGYEVVGGLRFSIIDQLTGEVFAGYLEQDYVTSTDISGVAYGAELDWKITRLTSMDIWARREVRETGQFGTAGYLHSALGASFEHELLRSLNLRFGVQFAQNDYESILREEDILTASTGVAWKAARNFTIELDHDWTQRESNIAGADYARSQVMLSVVGAF